MSLISPDRRRIDARPDPEAERDAAESARQYVEVRMRLARALLRIERAGAFHLSSCSSIVQYAVRLGLPASEARAIVDLGRAIEAPAALVLAPIAVGAVAGEGAADATVADATPAADAADAACGDGAADGATGGAAAEDAPAPPSASAAPDQAASGPAAPSIEEGLRDGCIPVANAALVGKLVAQPGLILPGENWIDRARNLPTPALRRLVNERIEQAAQGVAPLVSVTVHITERTREEFHRARVIASREAALALTEGQAFTRIVRFYLDARDELRRGTTGSQAPSAPRTNAARPDAAGTRYIPADARRAVVARSGDRCEVPDCALDTFLEFAHVERHASGGDRSDANLLRLCHVHHTQFDADCLVLACWRDGHPVFRDARGEEIGLAGPGASPRPRERADDLANAVHDRRSRASQVSEPVPEYDVGAMVRVEEPGATRIAPPSGSVTAGERRRPGARASPWPRPPDEPSGTPCLVAPGDPKETREVTARRQDAACGRVLRVGSRSVHRRAVADSGGRGRLPESGDPARAPVRFGTGRRVGPVLRNPGGLDDPAETSRTHAQRTSGQTTAARHVRPTRVTRWPHAKPITDETGSFQAPAGSSPPP